MRKKLAKAITAVLIMTILSGCRATGPAQTGGEPAQNQAAGDGAFSGDSEGGPAAGSGVPAKPQTPSDSEPQVNYMDEIYTEEENILSIAQAAEEEGISYKIENVEYTESFGDRDRERLQLFTPGVQADSKGTLSEGFKYLFLKITFTNTTGQTQEIYRTSNGIWVIGASLNTIAWVSDTCYYDVDWEKGTEGQKHHWVLEPGESVTSEIGWIIEGCSSMLAADGTLEARMGSGGPYTLYYRTGQSSGDNEGCSFIDLGVKVE